MLRKETSLELPHLEGHEVQFGAHRKLFASLWAFSHCLGFSDRGPL